MRYELKMNFDSTKMNTIIQILLSSPLVFREIYYERKVNNVYFDTLDYQDYKANIDGLYQRSKFRIRWYGESETFYPVLEEKIKKGDLGFKKFVKIDTEMTQKEVLSHYKKIEIQSLDLSHPFGQRHPVLINTYIRRYYLSANQKIRVTIDKNLSFSHPMVYHKSIDRYAIAVLELKFEQADYQQVQTLIQHLNLRFDKNSKYVEGINILNSII
jgi:SPX domain protein involved in polyphosphate accumulation